MGVVSVRRKVTFFTQQELLGELITNHPGVQVAHPPFGYEPAGETNSSSPFHLPARDLSATISGMKKLYAEAFGSFGLVFAGTGAIIINQVSSGAITHVGTALTFGLIILAMIYTFGDISGAHFNPAVTIGFWAARRLPGRDVGPYIASQCVGALLASGILRTLFPKTSC
jgi:hypothetical protein